MRQPDLIKLFLLRHPPVALAQGLCYGRSDVPAQPMPETDITRLRAAVPQDAVIWSSQARRCLGLAQRLAESGALLRVDARLQEMDFGHWEMQRFDDIDRALIDTWADDPWGFCPPGGESADAMSRRVLSALADIVNQSAGKPILLVAHAGPLRVIRGCLQGIPRGQWLGFDCEPARLFQMVCDKAPLLSAACSA